MAALVPNVILLGKGGVYEVLKADTRKVNITASHNWAGKLSYFL